MEFGKRHDTTDTTDFCLRQLVTETYVADLLCTCYGETGVMDFGLRALHTWTTVVFELFVSCQGRQNYRQIQHYCHRSAERWGCAENGGPENEGPDMG